MLDTTTRRARLVRQLRTLRQAFRAGLLDWREYRYRAQTALDYLEGLCSDADTATR